MPEEKNPFDTYIIHNLIKNSADSGEFIISQKSFKNFSWHDEDPLNYIFIGDQAYFTDADVDSLLHFVERGNNVFLSQEFINTRLYDEALGLESSNIYLEDHLSNEYVCCIGKEDCYSFKFSSVLSDTLKNDWYYFYGLPYNDTIEYLGRFDGKEVNFYRTKYGQGHFYFHSTPLLFTNYYMSDSINWEYANKIFGFLPGDNFYWDKHAYLNITELYDDIYTNPLKHIMANGSFMWAWYIMLALVVMFLVFNSKRRQRSIPFLESNENSSIEFTETIGQLYLKENNHIKIIKLMMKMFLFNLYSKYNIPVHKNQDKNTLDRLSRKTGVSSKQFTAILEKYNSFQGSTLARSEDLIRLYQQIRNYNNSCR